MSHPVDGEHPTYPNVPGKHAFDAFFHPEDNVAYVRESGLLDGFAPPEGIVLCYQRQVVEHSRTVEGLADVPANRTFRGIYTLPSTHHRIGVLGGFGFGSPVACLLMEDFIALGTTKFISIGTAGGLQKSSRVGDIVLCEQAIRDEGVSHHYVPPGKYARASPELTARLADEFVTRGIAYTGGCAWTIDTPYRETVEEARRYQHEGVACVEMEAAALFSVARCRSVQVASAFVISDLLADAVWEPQMRSEQTVGGLHSLYDAAVAALQS
ncbi:MAG TPA: nucleoside phosphorylase [Acidimicrobiales bacterium]|jgi:uridine phosphorylase